MTTNEILKQIIGNGNKTHFAKKHGISRGYFAAYIGNRRNIPITKLEKIAGIEGYKIILNVEKI